MLKEKMFGLMKLGIIMLAIIAFVFEVHAVKALMMPVEDRIVKYCEINGEEFVGFLPDDGFHTINYRSVKDGHTIDHYTATNFIRYDITWDIAMYTFLGGH